MSGQPAVSARTLARALALAMAPFVLVSGASCNQESFDLLGNGGAPAAGASNGAAGMSGTPITVGSGGRTGSGGQDRDGGPRAGFGGGSGSFGFGGDPQAGSVNSCPPGEVCLDGGSVCPPTVSSCKHCSTQNDCGHGSPSYCDPFSGLCVECRAHENDCAVGQKCDPYSLRCEKPCQMAQDCDPSHPVCADRGVCVECQDRAGCKALRPQDNDVCFANFCVECADSSDCTSFDKPVCQALHCVPRH